MGDRGIDHLVNMILVLLFSDHHFAGDILDLDDGFSFVSAQELSCFKSDEHFIFKATLLI